MRKLILAAVVALTLSSCIKPVDCVDVYEVRVGYDLFGRYEERVYSHTECY